MSRDLRNGADRARAELAMSLTGYALDVPLGELRGATRGSTDAAFARQAAMYLSHVAFGMSLARVAAAFQRDRSTVAHACHVMEDRRDDAGFDAWLEALEASARSAPQPQIATLSGLGRAA
ncbi:MAG: helix-turn-helix domain-containing protein [Alphaproteobacteria bacterium]|nr:helix-turn-helix domain-containing protein [Alphaproteobacteria bacterium]